MRFNPRMNAISVDGFPEFRSKVASPALQAIADHWRHACADNPMPSWSDLSPSHLAPYFTRLWAFKYDRVAGDFSARLAGNRAMVGFGKSFRGTPLKDLHPPHIFELAQAHMTKVVTGPAFYYCTGKLFKAGSQEFEGERVMLPLASNGRLGDGVLGATDFPSRATTGSVELLVGKIEWFSL
jgi:hypothetical protein